MSTDPPHQKPSALFGFINSTLGKITIFVTFVTTVFTALKLLGSNTRLAIIVVFVIGTVTFLLGALYVLFKKREIRTESFKTGVQIRKDFAYSKAHRSAAAAVLVIIPILWGAGLYFNFLEALTGKQVSVQGFVLTAGGEPADKALVTLFLNEKEVETKEAVGGKFDFTGVDISKPDAGAIRIEVKWRNLESSLAVNLSKDRLNNLVIKLPPGPPPFKVDYFVLEGSAIDFLVRGQIDKRWEERLGGQPTIVLNDVYNHLKSLLGKFSAPLSSDNFDISNSGNKSNPLITEEVAARNKNQPFFLGGIVDHPLIKAPTREEFISLLSPGQKWHLIVKEEIYPEAKFLLPKISADSFFFWRFATPADAKYVLQGEPYSSVPGVKKAAEFYSHITKDYLPPDFFIMRMQPSAWAEGECPAPTSVIVETRHLKLRVALLENISDKSIRIGKFGLRENNLNRLRSRDEDASMLNAKPPEQKIFYPSEVLRPKEKLVVPLELLLAHTDGSQDGSEYRKETPPELVAELNKAGQIKLPVGEGDSVAVETSTLVSMIGTPPENPEVKKEFVFGASLKIENLDVDGVSYPFRPLDTNVLVMNNGVTEGSCPYVFTYAAESNTWVNEGTILYNFDRKWKESTDEKELKRFDGRILLREIDPETSFIDKIYIKAIDYRGRERILSPKNHQLLDADGHYLVLKQGDQQRIDFNVPQGLNAQRFILVAKGYYIPYPARYPTRK